MIQQQIPPQSKRSSQEVSKNILQNITNKDQNQPKQPSRPLSPFFAKINRSRSGSPERSKSNLQNGNGLNTSKVEIGNTNIYSKSSNQKCTINKLGLSLRPYCSNKEHKRCNISHICIADQCQDQEAKVPRFGCHYCVIERHSSHKEACIPIEQFSDYNDTQSQIITECFKEMNFQCLKINNPPFLQKIFDSLNMLKLSISQHIDNQKVQLKQQIQERTEENIPGYQDRIESYSLLQKKFKEISQKKLFELDEPETELLLKFSKQEFLDEMNNFKKKLQNTFSTLEYQTDLATGYYQSSITNFVQCVLKNHEQVCMPTKKDLISLPGNTKLKFIKLQYFVLQKKQEEIFKNLKELKIQMGDEEIVNQPATTQAQTISSEILNSGKLLIYTDQCKHTKTAQIVCNTAPIFNCCKQSYQCVQCHNNHTLHKPTISEPSQRVCMKCFSIFSVNYATDVPINCNACFDVKIQDQLSFSLLQNLLADDSKQNNSKKRATSPSPNFQKRSTAPQIIIDQTRSTSPQLINPYQSKSRQKLFKDEKINTTNHPHIKSATTAFQSYKKENKQ